MQPQFIPCTGLAALGLGLTLVLFASGVSAQTWTETGDAMSFPDEAPQPTRGGGPLLSIAGTTGTGDARDAYCIRIEESFAFLATTDPNRHADAGATFDTRLFLFDESGRAVLANDDAPDGGSSLSTLDRLATDGSGFALEQRGRYTVVVAGADDGPRDSAGLPLFDFTAGSGLVHAPTPGRGSFADWNGGAPATGSYTLGLEGAEFCQDSLSAVFTKSDIADGAQNRICVGDGAGGFSHCVDAPDSSFPSRGAALGYLDPNAHLDLVVANDDLVVDRVCSGGERGLVFCANVAAAGASGSDVALGDLDGDGHLDGVFAQDGLNTVCLGDGGGLLSTCAEIPEDTPFLDSADVALGFVDDDAHLDAVFATLDEANRVCLGDGAGGFQACTSISPSTADSYGVVLGRVDGDTHLDAIFANARSPDEVCLGQGGGLFDCSAIQHADSSVSIAAAAGYLDDDAFLDVVFARFVNDPDAVCLGDGSGLFTCNDIVSEPSSSLGVALGLMNEDPHLDAVFAGDVDRICLGDGGGEFECSVAVTGGVPTPSTDVELGPLVDAWIFDDGFESGDTSAWPATVP